MKIAHLIDSDGMYGAEAVVLSLMKMQKHFGDDPILMSLGGDTTGGKHIKAAASSQSFDIVEMRLGKGLNLRGAIELVRCAEKLKVDLIHCHGYKANIHLGTLPRSLRKLPVLTTLHGWTSHKLFSRMGLYKLLDVCSMKNLDRVVAVSSNALEDRMLRLLRIVPVVVRNGIPRLHFKKERLQNLFPDVASKCQEKFSILSIGRLSKEKGVAVLVKALKCLIDQHIDTFLAVVGEGKERVVLQEMARTMGLSDKIIFLGYQEQAYDFIPWFDVFVLPSYTEGLPITLLESMQAGIPVVATNVGEIPLVLDNGNLGQLVIPGNFLSVANGITKVYKTQAASRDKASAAKDKVLNEYGIKRMAREYQEQYISLIQ